MARERTVIIGAGFTGLLAARALRAAGHDVLILDKASRPGGRLSTRRLGGGRIDSGVRSFGVRDQDVMQALLQAADGVLRVRDQLGGWLVDWEGEAESVAQALAADLRIETAFVTHLRRAAHGVDVGVWGSARTIPARQVLLTMPTPQAQQLLQRSGLPVPAGVEAIDYERRLVLLALLDAAPTGAVAWPAVFDDIEVSAHEGVWALRARVSVPESAARWGEDATHTLARLLLEVSGDLGAANVTTADCKRWRYALPSAAWEATVVQVAGLPIFIGGDGLGRVDAASPVERACRSGLDLATAGM